MTSHLIIHSIHARHFIYIYSCAIAIWASIQLVTVFLLVWRGTFHDIQNIRTLCNRPINCVHIYFYCQNWNARIVSIGNLEFSLSALKWFKEYNGNFYNIMTSSNRKLNTQICMYVRAHTRPTEDMQLKSAPKYRRSIFSFFELFHAKNGNFISMVNLFCLNWADKLIKRLQGTGEIIFRRRIPWSCEMSFMLYNATKCRSLRRWHELAIEYSSNSKYDRIER